ncbi:MAG: efflux RND transporter periplasmic adaptor subunit [Bilophila sp.]
MLWNNARLTLHAGATVVMGTLIGCLALVGCDQKGASVPPAPPAVEVGVEVITPRQVLYTTELAGRTSPFQIAEVRPQVSGIIQKRLFEEGADVKAGETLYQIDRATYKANHDSAKATLARAEANVAPARLKMERFKDLVHISAVSKQEYEDAEAAYKQAQADVGVNRAAVENARIRLDYTRVTSPISGRIGRSTVTPGALVTENQATSLATVQQLNPIYVDVTQSSTEVMRLRRSLESGQLQRSDDAHATVVLRLEDGSKYAEQGSLQFTDVSVDQSTGVVTLRALFPNPRQELLPGMYVRAVLNEGVDDNAILLSQRALVRDAKGNATTYVVNAENKIELRPIKVGRTFGDAWVVLDGLKAGERVVVEGLQKIRPGALVRATELPTAPATPVDPKKSAK